jgi:hypothetical protein
LLVPGNGIIVLASLAREVAHDTDQTRRALLAGGTMLLAGRAAAQQATTLRLYSPNFEPDAAMLAWKIHEELAGADQAVEIV